MPLLIVFQWLIGPIAFAILGGGGYLIYDWYRDRQESLERLSALGRLEEFRWTDGIEPLIFGVALLAIAFLGRPLLLMLLGRQGTDDPRPMRDGQIHKVKAADGTELHAEVYGPEDGVPIVMTHGWGVNSTAWYYAKKELGKRYRLILWDLPGLGESGEPPDKDWAIEKQAGYLAQILPLVGDRTFFLLGHSIGGLIMQSFYRLFPQEVEQRLLGLIFVHTTYINPARTTFLKGFLRAIQGPVVVPLMYLNIALSPLVQLMNWMSYLNGSLLLTTAFMGFGGSQTRGQLDFMAHFMAAESPAVQARGNLATFEFDERATLPRIDVPTLVIVAESDRVTIPEASATIASAIPSAELVTLSPANHAGFMEQHERFAELVSHFVEAHREGKQEAAQTVYATA